MANNVQELRLAFLLTPQEMAARMGADPSTLERLESGEQPICEEWIEAVSRALGVPASAVTDPSADIRAIVAGTDKLPARRVRTCPIGARYAILALVAKYGGLKIAQGLDEEHLARAVQNLVNYVEAEIEDAAPDEPALSRLLLPLQIIVLTILQSRGISLSRDPERAVGGQTMTKSLEGAIEMLLAFSHDDRKPGATAG